VRILVVEDDRKLARFVRQGLWEEGHAVEIATDGPTALELALGDPA
jgi:DNA-binding response OmpR family regulator